MPRCEGYIRKGGVFTFGPIEWIQCNNDAVVEIKFKQKDEPVNTLPACHGCWQKCIDSKNIEIISVNPIAS
jgi:hypothetical protein